MKTYPLGAFLLSKNSQNYEQILANLGEFHSLFFDYNPPKKSILVNNSLLIIAPNDFANPTHQELLEIKEQILSFAKSAEENGFLAQIIEASKITQISGNLGNFTAQLDTDSIEFSQAALFIEDENLMRFFGIESARDFAAPNELLSTLKERVGEYEYFEKITYNPKFCQFEGRREPHCAACANICPTFGITANLNFMHLNFSVLDCISCGACVGICPTSCLEFTKSPKDCFFEALSLLEGNPLLLLDKKSVDLLESEAKNKAITFENLQPMILENLEILNELDLLSLVQSSGRTMAIFASEISDLLLGRIEFLNKISNAIFKQNCILLLDSLESIKSFEPNNLGTFATFKYKNKIELPMRQNFSERLLFWVKNGDFGRIENIAPVRYGEILVDKDKCTLCLSCVGACNVGAIFANECDFSLRHISALCTQCGYCVSSCAENALLNNSKNSDKNAFVITNNSSGIALNPSFFEPKILAQDAPHKCPECGKIFATKRGIDKVVESLSALFLGNSAKMHSLLCCPDCKVRVMFGANIAPFEPNAVGAKGGWIVENSQKSIESNAPSFADKSRRDEAWVRKKAKKDQEQAEFDSQFLGISADELLAKEKELRANLDSKSIESIESKSHQSAVEQLKKLTKGGDEISLNEMNFGTSSDEELSGYQKSGQGGQNE